jgi:hypothetical protein
VTDREALLALAEPEPDEPLQGHPENVTAWDAWNARRLEAFAHVAEIRAGRV